MPVLREAFAKFIPSFEPVADVSVVRICETEETYKQYVDKNFEWSIGVWKPMRRELVILSQGKDKEKTLVPYKPTTAIKNKLFHHEGTKGTKFINHSPLLRVLRAFVVRIPGCGLRPR